MEWRDSVWPRRVRPPRRRTRDAGPRCAPERNTAIPTLDATPDVALHYADTGGEGRPVVLIHGWPLSGAAWKEQRARAAAGRLPGDHVRPPRLRRSDKPLTGYTYDHLSDDLAGIVEGSVSTTSPSSASRWAAARWRATSPARARAGCAAWSSRPRCRPPAQDRRQPGRPPLDGPGHDDDRRPDGQPGVVLRRLRHARSSRPAHARGHRGAASGGAGPDREGRQARGAGGHGRLRLHRLP